MTNHLDTRWVTGASHMGLSFGGHKGLSCVCLCVSGANCVICVHTGRRGILAPSAVIKFLLSIENVNCQ